MYLNKYIPYIQIGHGSLHIGGYSHSDFFNNKQSVLSLLVDTYI